MTTELTTGQRTWKATVDEYGFIDYTVEFHVRADPTDGPTNVLLTPGLPLYGSWWIIDNDVNLWAWRRWDTEIEPEVSNEPNVDWVVRFKFSTKWPSPKDGDRPYQNDPPSDPRLDPPKITGSFIRYTQEATNDRFGNFITNSAFEVLRGPQVEFDRNRLQIKIEMNVAQLPLSHLMGMADTVNAVPIWGCPPRTVKLSEPNFELTFFGQGIFYWKLSLTFDIDFGTWDRDLLDEGTKVLNGHFDVGGPNPTGNWVIDPIAPGVPPDPTNPQHFIRYKDRNGENTRVVLNGMGLPANVGIGGGRVQANITSMYMASIFMGIGTKPPDSGWVPISGMPTAKVSEWTSGVNYYPGSLVAVVGLPALNVVVGTLFLCLKANNTVFPPDSTTSWIGVPGDFTPVNRGAWDENASYAQGDVVTVPTTITVNLPIVDTGMPGNIHVEKYAESDFSLLGIPLTLPLTY